MKDVEKLVDSNGVVMQIVDGAARDMIAAEYDETESYAVGDYCIYNDHYYKCNTAIPSGGETWDATHWDATTLGAEDREIKQSLSDLATVDTGDSPSILNVNDTFQIPANVWKHNLIIVSARRQGLGNSTVFRKSDLASFDAGFNLMASNTESYRLKCSNTGVLTLISKTSGLNEPFITTTGIF